MSQVIYNVIRLLKTALAAIACSAFRGKPEQPKPAQFRYSCQQVFRVTGGTGWPGEYVAEPVAFANGAFVATGQPAVVVYPYDDRMAIGSLVSGVTGVRDGEWYVLPIAAATGKC